MRPIYTLRNDEWKITVKIGRAPMNNRFPIEADFFRDDEAGKQIFHDSRFYPNLAEALAETITILGMTHSSKKAAA